MKVRAIGMPSVQKDTKSNIHGFMASITEIGYFFRRIWQLFETSLVVVTGSFLKIQTCFILNFWSLFIGVVHVDQQCEVRAGKPLDTANMDFVDCCAIGSRHAIALYWFAFLTANM